MTTTIYIKRHSEPFNKLKGERNTTDSSQLLNEKQILSVDGERLASDTSNIKELKHIDVLYASSYVRTQQTAKYICENNQIVMNIDDRLGERRYSTNANITPAFYDKEWEERDYVDGDGESINMTAYRMNVVITEIINNNKNKTICIVGHATAIFAYFSLISKVYRDGLNFVIEYNNEEIFRDEVYPNVLFKLVFDDNNNLIEFKNIRY